MASSEQAQVRFSLGCRVAGSALGIAGKTGSELHLVYVEFLPPTIDTSVERVTKAILEDKREGQEAAGYPGDADRRCGGVIRQAHLKMGRPDEEILALAEEIGTGLIVVRSRGLGGLKRALLGSVSSSVVRYANCPVLVVGREEGTQNSPEDPSLTARRPREETSKLPP